MRAWKKWLFFLIVGGAVASILWVGIAGWRLNCRERSLWDSEREFNRVILPVVDFRDTPFREAMNTLIGELELRSGKRWRWRLATVDPEKVIGPETRITLKLSNVPAGEALMYTIKLAGGRFTNRGGRVVEVFPAGVRDDQLITRQYRVPENVLRHSFPSQIAGFDRGDNDLEEHFRRIGIEFDGGSLARYNSQSERLVISLPTEKLDFFEMLMDPILFQHREWSLVERVSQGIDRFRSWSSSISSPPAPPGPIKPPGPPSDPFAAPDPFSAPPEEKSPNP